MKKVLIITYYWPPAGGPGVQRWLKLSKYLTRLDVKPYVLTVRPDRATYPLIDESLKKEVASGVEVFTSNTKNYFGTYKKASGRKDVPFSGFASEKKKLGLKEKILRFIRGNFFIPDPRRGWNRFAREKAVNLIRTYAIKTVITTGPPHSTHLIGLWLKRKLGVHWIADFRDPWTDIYYYKLFYPTRFARRYDSILERRVLEQSDQIISVTRHWKDLYIGKSTRINPEKICVIPNGYDMDDFKNLPSTPFSRGLVITYAGTVTKQYPIDGFLRAVQLLSKPVVLRFIGKWDDVVREKLLQAENKNITVEMLDYLPKTQLNVYLANTDAQLFIIPDVSSSKGHVSGKLFDYMGVRKPVIGIGPVDGDAAFILEETGIGKMFSYNASDEEIKDYLQSLYDHPLQLNLKSISRYNRAEQAKSVANLIKAL